MSNSTNKNVYLHKGDFIGESLNFKVDKDRCIHCGRCIQVCSSAVLQEKEGEILMDPDRDGIIGWAGCYRCQRCLAVCPVGAVSIMDKNPEDSMPASAKATANQLEALIRNRRSCRSYLDREVPREEIDEMLAILENLPTGSNRQSLEFSVVYKKVEMDKLREALRAKSFQLAEEGVYPGFFNEKDFQSQVELEPLRNPGDMFFVGAPHILIIHSPKDLGAWHLDPHFAVAYFDLICASRGLGSIIMTLPVGALNNAPELKAMLGIPEDRYFGAIVGFGYPKVDFARGVQREGIMKTHEITFPEL